MSDSGNLSAALSDSCPFAVHAGRLCGWMNHASDSLDFSERTDSRDVQKGHVGSRG